MLKLIHMEGQVGNNQKLLWPNGAAMSRLFSLSRPRNQVFAEPIETPELLWPARLINQQARLAKRKDYSRPIAIIAFILSVILAIIIGPVQLALIAIVLDYNWVTATYYPQALHYTFLASSFVALIDLAALAFAWNTRPKHTYQTITLTLGSLVILSVIWLSGCVISLQPHQLTILLIGITIVFLIAILFLNKQYVASVKNNTATKFALTIMMAIAFLVASFSVINLIESNAESDPARIEQQTIEMENARVEGVPSMLSDLTYLLCNSNYKVIFLAQDKTNGLFQCSKGDVYSVTDVNRRNSNSIRGAATYLGTTQNSEVSLNFPTAKYLYRNLPDALTEDELAIMYPATSEVELLDNVTLQLLNYWNNHNKRNLFVNIFYNTNLDTVTSTRDFVLMAAMDTMSLIDQLPNGNTRHGPNQGEMFAYIYEADTELKALNELGADPKNYANTSRESLTTLRHLSVRLNAGETYDYDTLRAKLESSFISPEI